MTNQQTIEVFDVRDGRLVFYADSLGEAWALCLKFTTAEAPLDYMVCGPSTVCGSS